MNKVRNILLESGTLFFLLLFLFIHTNPEKIYAASLASTPPMGWSTWNQLLCGDDPTKSGWWDENTIKQMADALVSSGLKDKGYVYINIDDCWGKLDQAVRKASDPQKYDTRKFPGGMKALADYIHSKGLKFGLYTSITTRTCQWRWGSLGHEQEDIDLFASWGVDYLKADWCSDSINTINRQAEFQKLYDAIVKNGSPMVFSIVPHEAGAWNWASTLSNLWRTDEDVKNDWSRIMAIIDNPDSLHGEVAGPGHWNDPDLLEVGVVPSFGEPGMTDTEYRSQFSLWAILAAPLIASNDIRTMSPATLETLGNTEVIAVNQDPAGKQGTRIKTSGSTEVWAKNLTNSNEKAVLFLNRGSATATISTNWTDIGLAAGKATVRDLWAKSDKGEFTTSYSASVAAHGGVMIKVSQGVTNSPTPTTTTHSPTPACFNASDVDCSGAVNANDILLVLTNYFKTSPSPLRADVNRDGKVNMLDAALVLKNYLP
jgi:alpha-galactosidase